VQIVDIQADDQEAQPMGSRFPVRAVVELGELAADDVLVEIYHGLLDTRGNIQDGETETMTPEDGSAGGRVTYLGEIPCRRSGQRGFTVRITPRNPSFPLDRFDTGLIRWFGEEHEARAAEPRQAGV
jgi:starch phosphorylase